MIATARSHGSAATIVALAWPQSRASEALIELARATDARPRPTSRPVMASTEEVDTLVERLESTAEEIGLELVTLETPYAGAEHLLTRAAPALIGLQVDGDVRLLALLSGGRRPLVLAPDGSRHRCDVEELRALWCAPHEAILEPIVAPVLDAAGLSGERRARARRALASEHLGAVPVGAAWMLRAPAERGIADAARSAGLGRLALTLVACSFGASLLAVLAWIPFGRGVLSGSFEPAWFFAWALLVVSALPLRWLEAWTQSVFGVRFALHLRRRLMAGATRLDPAVVRGEGAGRLLGRVLDSEALEGLVLGGGFVLLAAVIDGALCCWVLTQGSGLGFGPVSSIALFATWILVAFVVAAKHVREGRAQADARLAMTHDLVERMHGQRTRIVQEPREHWHVEEDALLERYLSGSSAFDRASLWLLTLPSTGWLVSGAVLVAWNFASASPDSARSAPLSLALGLGALLLGQQALARMSAGLGQLSTCLVVGRSVRPVYAAAAHPESPGLPRTSLRPARAEERAAETRTAEARATGERTAEERAAETSTARREPSCLLQAHALHFRHAGRERDVLAGASFELRPGDRVLLEGPSGGGKSTLVSLIAGWREPRAGSLLLNGLDRASHGARRWRRRVAVAPQFHENHVFTGTLAFNLLLALPPEPGLGAAGPTHVPHETRAEALALELCEELGLGDLVRRMPSGLRQVVGETGWQLSHGERSRLFVARALLADADLVVLDESLAALDPETAGQVLDCVRRRARTLVVVAHP